MPGNNSPFSRSMQGKQAPVTMVRVAVAGSGGLARLIAHSIEQDTSHHVVILSRSVRLSAIPAHMKIQAQTYQIALDPSFSKKSLATLLQHDAVSTPALTFEQYRPRLSDAGYQIAVVDYERPDTLQFALRGIDTVISTVTGPSQIALIQAAVTARVRRFAPAEFEGQPLLRASDDPFDHGRAMARQWLNHYAQSIQSTSFVCGILYERFQPGGLATSHIGTTSGLNGEGDYLMNCRTMLAQAPAFDASNPPNTMICMTAAQDVARFVTRALDLQLWPPELRMQGQRVEIMDLFLQVERLSGRQFNIEWYSPLKLAYEMQVAVARNDNARTLRLRALMNTCEGQYDFTSSNLNQIFYDVRPIDFETWFIAKWNLQQ